MSMDKIIGVFEQTKTAFDAEIAELRAVAANIKTETEADIKQIDREVETFNAAIANIRNGMRSRAEDVVSEINSRLGALEAIIIGGTKDERPVHPATIDPSKLLIGGKESSDE